MDWAKRKDTRLEDKVLKAADYTIVISNGMKEMYQENSPRIQVIYNSYDDAKFARPTVGGVPEQGFLFTYTGNFLTTQNVPKLWEALAELRSTRPEIKLLLIGDADATIKQAIEVAGIADMVIYKAYMPHAEVINYMWYSHLLLFLLANVPDSKLLMTGKVFEYLPTGTALMGIGPTDGSAGEVMKLSHRPAMIQYEDKEAMKQRIAECYDYWQQHGVGQKFTDPAYQYFAASNITAQLADLLNKITKTTAK